MFSFYWYQDITTRVIARELKLEETPVSKVMTRNPTFVLADTLAVEALQKMVQGVWTIYGSASLYFSSCKRVYLVLKNPTHCGVWEGNFLAAFPYFFCKEAILFFMLFLKNHLVSGKFRHLPVVENGEVVALLDIAKCLYDAIARMERAAEKGKAIAAAVEGVEKHWGAAVSGL